MKAGRVRKIFTIKYLRLFCTQSHKANLHNVAPYVRTSDACCGGIDAKPGVGVEERSRLESRAGIDKVEIEIENEIGITGRVETEIVNRTGTMVTNESEIGMAGRAETEIANRTGTMVTTESGIGTTGRAETEIANRTGTMVTTESEIGMTVRAETEIANRTGTMVTTESEIGITGRAETEIANRTGTMVTTESEIGITGRAETEIANRTGTMGKFHPTKSDNWTTVSIQQVLFQRKPNRYGQTESCYTYIKENCISRLRARIKSLVHHGVSHRPKVDHKYPGYSGGGLLYSRESKGETLIQLSAYVTDICAASGALDRSAARPVWARVRSRRFSVTSNVAEERSMRYKLSRKLISNSTVVSIEPRIPGTGCFSRLFRKRSAKQKDLRERVRSLIRERAELGETRPDPTRPGRFEAQGNVLRCARRPAQPAGNALSSLSRNALWSETVMETKKNSEVGDESPAASWAVTEYFIRYTARRLLRHTIRETAAIDRLTRMSSRSTRVDQNEFLCHLNRAISFSVITAPDFGVDFSFDPIVSFDLGLDIAADVSPAAPVFDTGFALDFARSRLKISSAHELLYLPVTMDIEYRRRKFRELGKSPEIDGPVRGTRAARTQPACAPARYSDVLPRRTTTRK
ncbi:hypothetical protein EVAR_96735_1 [Eumeta japonica]|uniref:Uncharacterized protein n=1 Tax=Eumeta variegata TaxID=151549 RepID=A0A4C1XYX8_EUMVA|nr:hypothetical protein EVAR_96735_1 [Eumeta japonica]